MKAAPDLARMSAAIRSSRRVLDRRLRFVAVAVRGVSPSKLSDVVRESLDIRCADWIHHQYPQPYG